MPHRDLADILQRGAARPAVDHDIDELWQRGRARRRRKRLAAAGSAVLVVAAVVAVAIVRGSQPSVPFIEPSPDSAAATARLHVEQTFEGGFYTEGSFGYVEVYDVDSGELVIEEVFTGEGPPVFDHELAAGRYRLVSFQRPCEASCPDGDTPGGALDPPTDRCETTFEATPSVTVVATITVTPGQGCATDLDVVAPADAPRAPCPSEDVALATEGEAVASGATLITMSLTHAGQEPCAVTTGVRLALTDGQGHLLDVEGNPYTRHVVEPLEPGSTMELAAVWTSWCENGSRAVMEVDTTAHGSVSVDVPAPTCRADAPPQLRLVEPTSSDGPAADSAHARVDAEVDGAPPFYIDLGNMYPEPRGDVWATHRLSVISEWRTPIAVSIADGTVRFPRDSNGQAEIELGQPATQTLEPNEETTITLAVVTGSEEPRPGSHTAILEVPFWRDVDPAGPPAGQPDGTAIIRLTYELLAADEFAAVQRFCEEAPDPLQRATTSWLASDDGDVQPLLEALTAIEAASEPLSGSQKDRLRREIELLREKLERLRDGQRVGHDDHEGFDTTGVVSIVNHLCGTDVTATGIQP